MQRACMECRQVMTDVVWLGGAEQSGRCEPLANASVGQRRPSGALGSAPLDPPGAQKPSARLVRQPPLGAFVGPAVVVVPGQPRPVPEKVPQHIDGISDVDSRGA